VTEDKLFRVLKRKFAKGDTVPGIKKLICGRKLGSGVYRETFELLQDKRFVVKIERDTKNAYFTNVCEFRNYITHKDWRQLGPWLAPCIAINENGSILIQRRATIKGKKRSDFPKKVPAMLTDLKVTNFGWIGKRFVCFDYPFMPVTVRSLGKKGIMRVAKWRGSLQDANY